MAKKKAPKALKPVPQSTEAAPAQPEIPKDLQDKLGAVRALAACFNLLQRGSFTVEFHQQCALSLQFLQALHQQALGDACSHPKASLVPELQQFIVPKQS